jgi:hypothetical protein
VPILSQKSSSAPTLPSIGHLPLPASTSVWGHERLIRTACNSSASPREADVGADITGGPISANSDRRRKAAAQKRGRGLW